jgi:hypothetical protein
MRTLSRAELKTVMGGKLPGQGYCSYFGTCTTWPPSPEYDPDDPAAANEAQAIADEECSLNTTYKSCCTTVDCPGAD